MGNSDKSSPRPKPRKSKSRYLTKAAVSFFKTGHDIHHFLHWVTFMAGRIDDMQWNAHKTLLEVDKKPVPPRPIGPMIKELTRQRQFLLETVLVRTVDNYLNYLVEILGLVWSRKPKISLQQEAVLLESDLEDAHTIQNLKQLMIQKKQRRFSYKSFTDQEDYFQKAFKIALATGDHRNCLSEGIALRNLIVHRRCICDHGYVKAHGPSPSPLMKAPKATPSSLQVGHLRALGIQEIEHLESLVVQSVTRVDGQLGKAFKLRKRISSV